MWSLGLLTIILGIAVEFPVFVSFGHGMVLLCWIMVIAFYVKWKHVWGEGHRGNYSPSRCWREPSSWIAKFFIHNHLTRANVVRWPQVYIDDHMHTYTQASRHTYIHIFIARIHTSLQRYIHSNMHAFINACLHSYKHRYMQTSMHACIHCTHTYIHKSIHTYKHANIHTSIKHAHKHACLHTYKSINSFLHSFMHACIQPNYSTADLPPLKEDRPSEAWWCRLLEVAFDDDLGDQDIHTIIRTFSSIH